RILDAVFAQRRGAAVGRRAAHAAQAVAVTVAAPAAEAMGTGEPATVDVALLAVLDTVGAERAGADAALRIADVAIAVRAGLAALAVGAGGADAAAAVDVGLGAVLQPVFAARADTLAGH